MAESRSLKLSILADVDNLTKGLRKGSDDVETFGDKLGRWSKVAGIAFAAAAAAAGAYAIKLGVDGVKAAIEDEAAQEKLSTTLRNVTGATDAQIAATQAYIDKTQLAYGVTDDQLRPSLERLTRATKDVEKAQSLQTIALDVAAGSGKSLEAVSNAISKAYEGNNTALGKLGIGIDSAQLKTMSFDEVTAALSKTFEGQASVQAETFAGKLDRMKIGFDEAKESLGKALMPILESAMDTILHEVIPAFQAFIDILTGQTDATKKSSTRIADWEKNSANPATVTAQDFAIALRDLAAAFDTTDEAGKQASSPVSGLVSILKFLTAIVNVVTSLINGLKDLWGWFNKINDKLQNFYGAVRNVGASLGINPGDTYTGPPGRAAGGPVGAGRPYIVGEKGPELFVPNGSGKIIPNGVGGSVTNVYVSGALDPAGVARQIADLLNREATNSGTFMNLGMSRSFA